MNKKTVIPILALVMVVMIPNPVMAQVANYGYSGQPKPTYVESHYGIAKCANAFQYKFLCDRIDVMIQQNDNLLSTENTIKTQNDQLITIGKAQVCMTGYSSHGNFADYAKYFGINCNVGKP